MNIFPIDKDPEKCAIWSCDQHVVKIISEAVLIYSSALSKVNFEKWSKIPKEFKYGPINLPLVRWAMDTDNRKWLVYYIHQLNREYEYRYSKKHKAYSVFRYLSETFKERPYIDIELKIPNSFELCMPEEFKQKDSIEAYRNYYRFKYEKGFKRPMRWSKRKKPEFLK